MKSAMSTKVYWKARKLIQSTNEACSYIRSASKGYTISPLLDGLFCGDSWTRTNDPIDVNDVLYRLSHATTFAYRTHTSPVGHLEQFVLPTEPCHRVYKL